jgi:hypothetical protein
MTFKKIALAVMLATTVAGTASAAPIVGSIGFSGAASTWSFDGTCTTAANCNGFNLNPLANNIEVDIVSGDFAQAGSMINDIGTMNGVSVAALPVSPQWTMGIFTFTLERAMVNTVLNTPGLKFLNMSGSGTVSAAGFDDTFGVWSWTGTATGTSFTFAPTTTTEVPEPVSMSLVGLGLLAAGGMIRRRRAA